KEPLVVYTSNIFAVLGLRSFYFVLAGAMDLFHFLKYGLSIVLVFVGLKMVALDDLAGGRMPIGISLGVIVTTILASILLSLIFSRSPSRRERLSPKRIVMGCLSGALCCFSLVAGLGLRPAFLQLIPFDMIKVEWLYVSGMCWGLCCWLLLRP